MCPAFPILVGIVLPTLALGTSAHAGEAGGRTYDVSSADELAERCRSIQPGDTIILKAGTYTDQAFAFIGQGTKDRPITFRAETAGKVILNGGSRLTIDGTYLIADGLHFVGGALNGGSVVEFAANDGGDSAAKHCVLRNTVIKDYNPTDPALRYFWVTLNGYGHRVEHCMFSGQNHSGVTVCVRLENGKPAGHTIRRNHFAGRPAGNGNGFESLRIGTGSKLMTNARCVVTENLFEDCNGELEIISNKSCENIYTKNTFIRCKGTLTIRQGHRCRVEDNVFVADNVEGVGGLRVTGKDHRIIGNYFSGTTGTGGAAISLKSGVTGNGRGKYAQVSNCIIDGNTLVDNPGLCFLLGTGHEPEAGRFQPEKIVISNTLIVSTGPEATRMIARNHPDNIRWKNNVVVANALEEELHPGLRRVAEVPEAWKSRLQPKVLKPKDVGPQVRIAKTIVK